MTGRISNEFHGFYMDAYGKKTFYSQENGKLLLALTPLYEFALQIESDAYTGLITSHDCQKEAEEKKDCCCVKYMHPLFVMEVSYSMDEDAVYKNMCFTAKERLVLRYAQTEVSKTAVSLRGGGEGQPIFAGDSAFISILFPAAQNHINGNMIRLEQAPFQSLAKGEAFDFFPVIYGLAGECGAEEGLRRYIKKHKKKTPSGMRIYCDWGAHDEMAKEAELNEAMALRLLKELRRGRENGVIFDYYLMDAMWYEEKGMYQSFKKSAWKDGPRRFLRELKQMGMQFGLWFDVSMGMLGLPEQSVRRGGDERRACLGCEENINALFDGIRTQVKQCGCSMIKLDFAFFDCTDGGHKVHASDKTGSKEPAIRNFLRRLGELYRENPDLIVLGYNGFTTDQEYIASVDPGRKGHMISPWWCLYLDYLYCGDPRPAEFPTERLGDSLIYYTDSMIEQMAESGMPYSAIDDHGTMVGNTNTIYYLGKGSFRDSWIMNISRGSKRLLLYGEPALLEQEDWQFIAESRELFDFTCGERAHTEKILGSPAGQHPYGYSTSDGRSGCITLVNPCGHRETVLLEAEEWRISEEILLRKYYGDGRFQNNEYEHITKTQQISLAPFEVAVYQWKTAEEPVSCIEGYLKLEAEACEAITLSPYCRGFSLQLISQSDSPIRLFGKKEEYIRLECQSKGAVLERLREKPIWSGCSWVSYGLSRRTEGADRVVIRLQNQSGICLYVKWREHYE